MSLDLVLNDLSFVPLNSRQEAQEKMSGLIQTVACLNALGVKGSFRYSPTLFGQSLHSGYTVTDWINDSQVDKEARRKFLTTATKAPYLMDEPLAEAKKLDFDFQWNGYSCEAFGAAYLLDIPALSLNSDSCWQVERLKLQISQIDENSGELLQFEPEIIHAATPTHVLAHRDWILQKLSSPIKKGIDIWHNRHILYPRLEFCIEVEKQLKKILIYSHLKQIQERLDALQQYDDAWTDERMKVVLPDFSGESSSTMQRQTYAQLRDFTRPNGETVRCEWHMKMMQINLRLHFYWDKERNLFVVGYIGSHLPT